MAAFVALCFVSVPFALADTSSNDSACTTTAAQQAQATTATDGTKSKEAKPKATNRSVLVDEMLNSPISYFREAFSSEEEEKAGTAPGPDAVTITVKALVATLLSTIL